MKDHIFIGWSGSNAIAMKVKNALEAKNFRCTIGGNADNNSQYSSVGDTVIQQIKSCNQAIMIFMNRADGQVSNNLFFELGYVLAMYGQPKVHCVRRSAETVILPSDFDNSFVEPIECDVSSDDLFVQGILNYFFARQKMSVNENKMMLINNRYRMHDNIKRHFTEEGSRCSDYELAQYILFYTQAAHMFGDEVKVRREMIDFRNRYFTQFSEELTIAVSMSIAFFDMIIAIQSSGANFYLERSDFRAFKDKYEGCLNAVNDDDTGTFDEWVKIFICEHLTYAYQLYAANPDLDKKGKIKNVNLCQEWAQKTVEALEKLADVTPIFDNNDRYGIVSLFYAYVYRNMFLNCRELGDEEGAIKWLKKTYDERKRLKDTFDSGNIDTKLYENFAMEYYLTLIECLNYANCFEWDEDDIDFYEEEIENYVLGSRSQTEHSRYIDLIDSLLEHLRKSRGE